MTLHWPQITWLCLTLLSAGIGIAQHGKPKTGNNNMFINLIATALIAWLLYEGGFFSQQ
jgi:hypothetical protein